MMKIRSGKMDREIQIKSETETVQASGAVSKTWATIHSVRAEKLEANSLETDAAFGDENASTVMLKIRYLSNLKLSDRIFFEGDEYGLKSISEIGRKHGQVLRGVIVQ